MTLKIGILALYQESTILIISKFQYTQRIGSRQVKLKPISRGISYVRYTFSVSYNLSSEIGRPIYLHVNIRNNVQKMHTNANIDEKRYFV